MTERRTMAQRQQQAKDVQPDSFDQDLHPQHPGAGINHGDLGANPERNAPSAESLTELHRLLPDLTNDELRRIAVLPEGSKLEQGATYLDLRHMDRGEFTADRPQDVGPSNLNLFIPKQNVDYVLWNKLRGVTNPERLNQADDSSTR